MAQVQVEKLTAFLNAGKYPDGFANLTEAFVNSFVPDIEGWIEDIKKAPKESQERFSIISLIWVKRLSNMGINKQFDGRNEAAVERATRVVKLLESQHHSHDFFKGYDGFYDREEEFEENVAYAVQYVDSLSKTHKTLMQTVTKVFLRWLVIMGDQLPNSEYQVASDLINDEFDEYFCNLPFV